ncbi:FAD-dependent thymidylate synthase [Tunturiibacter gelidiferens]|uniref:FAD-dependent thymidylate synthase n=1 Tax=Tunturiibacter gelidiferens TaxID=3069689 RepID=UPI003D9B3E22
MAKYSRSALTMKESLAEISSQRAEQFLNTFYFAYGHRSIADLAHIPFAIERLSLLAAIELVDETRWDGQERSTRYQNFRLSGWFTPALAAETPTFTAVVERLFAAYDKIGAGMLTALKTAIQQPESMKPDAYDRTLKARAFDVARYLLPLATNTSLGQIVNARTLETQVSRLLTSDFAEIRQLGEKLRNAASEPAWNVQHAAGEILCEEIGSLDANCGQRIHEAFLRPVKAAPTLVKYATPNVYLKETRSELAHAAKLLMGSQPIAPAPVVDLLDGDEPLEIELATSLLYPHCHYPYRQLRHQVAALSANQRGEIVSLGTKHRGRHDELLRSFSSGHSLRFDILMDIGGFRDMHRHRRCVQLLQSYTDLHGYDEPICPGQPTLAEAGLETLYSETLAATYATYRTLRDSNVPEAAQSAQYLLPLATRCRSLFKMDFAEALYISELRSGVAGHFSYRRVAWEMYKAVAKNTRHSLNTSASKTSTSQSTCCGDNRSFPANRRGRGAPQAHITALCGSLNGTQLHLLPRLQPDPVSWKTPLGSLTLPPR